MEILKKIGIIILWILKVLSVVFIWILKIALEAAKLFLVLLSLVLRIVFAIIRGCSAM